MIGERIKQLRELNSYTQTTLAKRLGLSRSAINAWEMGISIPSTQYIVELAKLFRTTSDYILCLDSIEKIEIGDYTIQEKEMIYSLLNYFNANHAAVDLIKKNGLKVDTDVL